MRERVSKEKREQESRWERERERFLKAFSSNFFNFFYSFLLDDKIFLFFRELCLTWFLLLRWIKVKKKKMSYATLVSLLQTTFISKNEFARLIDKFLHKYLKKKKKIELCP